MIRIIKTGGWLLLVVDAPQRVALNKITEGLPYTDRGYDYTLALVMIRECWAEFVEQKLTIAGFEFKIESRG
jgi:hypothetical protein